MGTTTKIQWCDSTASPWTGCTPVSAGCDNCYARTMAKRRGWSKEWGAGVPRHRFSTFEQRVLAMERKARKGLFRECHACGFRGWIGDRLAGQDPYPCECGADSIPARPRVFPSLCDWLDPEVPVEWLADLLDVIRRTPHLDWMLLTKRPGEWNNRLVKAESLYASASKGCGSPRWIGEWIKESLFPDNVWIGATCENQAAADERIPDLLRIPAAVRFVSVEPMLGPVELTAIQHTVSPGYFGDAFGPSHLPGTPSEIAALPPYPRIDAVFCGGETGPHAQPMYPDWPRSLRDQCVAAEVAFTFKAWGSNPHPSAFESAPMINAQMAVRGFGRLLDGREWNQMPDGKDGGR